jgi:hypothetical protein
MHIQFAYLPKIFKEAFNIYPHLLHDDIDKIHQFIASIVIVRKSQYVVLDCNDLFLCIKTCVLRNYEIEICKLSMIKIFIGFVVTQYIGVTSYNHSLDHGLIKCMIWRYVVHEIPKDIFHLLTNFESLKKTNFEWVRIIFKGVRRSLFTNYDLAHADATEFYKIMQQYQTIDLVNIVNIMIPKNEVANEVLRRMHIIDSVVVKSAIKQINNNNCCVDMNVETKDVAYDIIVKMIENMFKEIDVIDGAQTSHNIEMNEYEFICPLSGKLFEDPIWHIDHYYEKKYLDEWINMNYLRVSPMTNYRIEQNEHTNNIDKFKEKFLEYKKINKF